MKNRIKAILLATGLTVSMLFAPAYAEEASTEAVTEAVTEASTEAAAEAAAEAESELAADEAAVNDALAEGAAEGKYAAYYDSMKSAIPQTLQALSAMTEEQLTAIIEDGSNASETLMAANWQSVREELGNFVEVTSQEITEENDVITITNDAKYDGLDEKTSVTVVYEYNVKDNTASLEWNIKYPMSKLMQQAGLNTLMGIGIVFLVLLFLSFLISQMHWIPDLVEKKSKEQAAAKAAAPVAAPAPAPVEVEEDLTDDLELVAVISAAIAASENTSADGFVVRSIKKANRRSWLNA